MLHRRGLLALLALAPACVHAPAAPSAAGPAVEVTYVANEGFLLQAGGRRIAVDAFFEGESIDWCHVPAPETVRLMRSASGPFEGIDLILITHWHVDHFSPGVVLHHLAGNPRAVVVAPPQVVSKMRADEAWSAGYEARIRGIDLPLFGSREITVEGIRVEAHRIRHGAYPIRDETTGMERDKHEGVENLAYLVDAGGVRFAHFGDALLKENADYFDGKRFTGHEVDVAFVEDWSDESLAILKGRFGPGTVVFMHMPPDAGSIERLRAYVASRIPNASIFGRTMDRARYPVRAAAARR